MKNEKEMNELNKEINEIMMEDETEEQILNEINIDYEAVGRAMSCNGEPTDYEKGEAEKFNELHKAARAN